MVNLPPELQALIAALVIFAVTEGLKVVAGWFKLDLSGFAAGLSAALVTVVVAFLNGLLGQVPAQYADAVNLALLLLVSILGAFGVHGIKKQFAAR